MKSLCLALLLAVSLSGCSMFKKNDGQSREYRRYLKKMKVQQDKLRQQIRQRAEAPVLRKQEPSEPQISIQTSESP